MNLKNDKNQYMLPIVNRSAQNCSDILIKFSEDMYSARLTETILSSFEKRIILISGPSASGKTTTAKKLADSLLSIGRAASVISMDDFYKHRFEMPVIDGKINAEIIEALEMDLLKKVMKEFLKTGKASLPRYDFTDGIRRDNFYEIFLTIIILYRNFKQKRYLNICEGKNSLRSEVSGINSSGRE